MSFLQEDLPDYGAARLIAAGVRRVVARNPSVMTYHGTNTYLIDGPGGTLVMDPGPDDAAHVDAIIAATDGAIDKIIVTHRHSDHVGATPALKAATRAPVFAFPASAYAGPFAPDVELADGQILEGLRCIHTPGHAADHLCFARETDGVLFSGDHVMSWSSSIVSPPGGDMADYFGSLRVLLERDDRLLLPGHGPALAEPRPFIMGLLDHRGAREESIWLALHSGPMSSANIVGRLYHKQHPRLRAAAERNVTAHLIKLQKEGRVHAVDDDLWAASNTAQSSL